MYRIVMFDLDGTTVDSYNGLIQSLKETLIHFDIGLPSDEELSGMLGSRTYDTFRNRFGKSHEDSMMISCWHRENYAKNHIFDVTPYKGIRELLQVLKDRGIITAIVTNKRQDLALSVLDHLDMLLLFDKIYGGSIDNSIRKCQSIERCLFDFGVDVKDAVLVGDTSSDLEAAGTSGVDFIPVSYGYEKWEGIKACKDSNELLDLLIK